MKPPTESKSQAVAGNRLVIPLQLAGVRIHGHDRAGIEVVPLPEVRFRDAAHFLRPRLGVARPGDHQVGFGVIDQAVPHRAAAAVLRPVADPGLGRLFLSLVLHGLARGRRNRVELPRERSVLEVVCREEAANEVLAAAHADDHLVARDARRDGQRVVLIDVRDLALPQLLAADGVERDQPGIVGRQDDLAVRDREPAVVRAAAHMARVAGSILASYIHFCSPVRASRAYTMLLSIVW